MIDAGELTAFTSELTMPEVLSGAYRQNKPKLADVYETYLSERGPIGMVGVHRTVLRDAARLGVEFNLRHPNAIHVATAMVSECEVFLTNDSGIKLPEGLKRVLPDRL